MKSKSPGCWTSVGITLFFVSNISKQQLETFSLRSLRVDSRTPLGGFSSIVRMNVFKWERLSCLTSPFHCVTEGVSSGREKWDSWSTCSGTAPVQQDEYHRKYFITSKYLFQFMQLQCHLEYLSNFLTINRSKVCVVVVTLYTRDP